MYIIKNQEDKIISGVDIRNVIGFDYDGTSPVSNPRYILKLKWGHSLVIDAIDLQHILDEIKKAQEL